MSAARQESEEDERCQLCQPKVARIAAEFIFLQPHHVSCQRIQRKDSLGVVQVDVGWKQAGRDSQQLPSTHHQLWTTRHFLLSQVGREKCWPFIGGQQEMTFLVPFRGARNRTRVSRDQTVASLRWAQHSSCPSLDVSREGRKERTVASRLKAATSVLSFPFLFLACLSNDTRERKRKGKMCPGSLVDRTHLSSSSDKRSVRLSPVDVTVNWQKKTTQRSTNNSLVGP